MPLRTASRQQSLISQVTDQLLAQIRSGEWPVGEQIPTEPELARALGVGRNTVREAVRALMHIGVLERRQGAGTFVTAKTELAGTVARRLADAPASAALELRHAMEVEASRLAAHRRTDGDLTKIGAALATLEHATRRGVGPEVVAADAALHHAIVTAAHSPVLAEIYGELAAAVRATLTAKVDYTFGPGSWVDHSPLVAAIRAGDVAAAAQHAGAMVEWVPSAETERVLVPNRPGHDQSLLGPR